MTNTSYSNVATIYSLYALGKKPEGGGSGSGGESKTLYELALEVGYAGSETDFSRDFNNVITNKLISPDGSARVTVKNAETIIKSLVDPVDLLDAVNLRTLKKAISDSEDKTNTLIEALEKKIEELETCECDPATIEQLVKDVAEIKGKIETLEQEVTDIKQSIIDTKTELEGKITDLRAELVLMIGEKEKELLDKIDALEKKHDDDMAKVNTDLTNLAAQHVTDITAVNKRIDDLESNLTVILENKFKEFQENISKYLEEQLPGMIEAEVKKQLADINPGSCDCDYPPDVVDGNVWPETDKEVLVFDNGKATSTDFDYVMTSNVSPDTIETIYREIWGGDSNPNDDPEFMSFTEWLQDKNLTEVFWGGDSNEKDDIIQAFRIWNGGSATSKW